LPEESALMTSTTKRGFHLPWGSDGRKPSEIAANAAAAAAAAPRPIVRRAHVEDLGRGPFDLAPAPDPEPHSPPAETTSPDSIVALEDRPSPRVMRGAVAPEVPPPVAPDGAPTAVEAGVAWPEVDRAGSASHSEDAPPPPRPRIVVESADAPSRPSRKDNPLVAGLVRAMRDSAKATRQETTTRMRAAASARMEELRTASTVEAVALKKQAEEDVVGIRAWSRAEMTRIKEETDQRIAGRRAQLAREAQTQVAESERLADEVRTAAATFETEMEQFFEMLFAEDDPARLATLAERLPEPPAFEKIAAKSTSGKAARNGASRAKGRARGSASKNGASRPRKTSPTTRRDRPTTPNADRSGSASDEPGDLAFGRLAPDAAAAAEAEAIADLDFALEPGAESTTGTLAAVLATAPRIDSPDDLSVAEIVELLGIDPDASTEESAPEETTAEASPPAAVPIEAPPAAVDEVPPPESFQIPMDDWRWGGTPEPANPPPASTEAESQQHDAVSPAEDGASPAVFAPAESPTEAPIQDQTRVVVSGLTSVAGISAFKSALGRVDGVGSVSVMSGEENDFIFAVVHRTSADLRVAIPGFAGFSAQMTMDDGGVLNFAVTEPA
jgi:hypothetical protein